MKGKQESMDSKLMAMKQYVCGEGVPPNATVPRGACAEALLSRAQLSAPAVPGVSPGRSSLRDLWNTIKPVQDPVSHQHGATCLRCWLEGEGALGTYRTVSMESLLVSFLFPI